MPLSNAHHGGPGEPFDLRARIEAELRARIEDAVDNACLAAMVDARASSGAPPPAAESTGDRQEYMARVLAFLQRLRLEILPGLGDEQRRRLGPAILEPETAGVEAAVSVQVLLAKELPDYWQRFEAVRLGSPDVTVERPPGASGQRQATSHGPSGREPRSLLDRLLRRG
jgi:hypothetical protein